MDRIPDNNETNDRHVQYGQEEAIDGTLNHDLNISVEFPVKERGVGTLNPVEDGYLCSSGSWFAGPTKPTRISTAPCFTLQKISSSTGAYPKKHDLPRSASHKHPLLLENLRIRCSSAGWDRNFGTRSSRRRSKGTPSTQTADSGIDRSFALKFNRFALGR